MALRLCCCPARPRVTCHGPGEVTGGHWRSLGVTGGQQRLVPGMVTAPGCSVAVSPGPARHKSLIKQLEVRTGPDETIMPSRLHTSPCLPARSKALDDSGFIRAAGWVFVTAAAGASPSSPRPQLSMTDTDLSSPPLLQLLARRGPGSGIRVSDV